MALWNRNRKSKSKSKSKRSEDDASAPESYSQKRRRRIRERAAVAKKKMLKPKPKVKPKVETEEERAKKMSTTTKVTATSSDVDNARKPLSGPEVRPQKPVAPPKAPTSDLTSSGTATAPKGDRRTPTSTIVGEKSTGAKGAKDNPVTVGGAKKRESDTFIGRDGKKKAAVTAEELKASGLSLRDYLNKQQGKTRRKTPTKKNMGGKVMAYKAGGGVKSRGTGKARKTNSCTMVKMKGS